MAISSILVLIVSILRSSKGRSVSQNAWLHWNWPIRNLLQKSFLLESLFGERGIALYIKTSARRCRMSSSGGDLPETLLRSTLDAGLCKFRVRLFQFCLIQGRKAAAENLCDSENMKIPITSNYLFKNLQILEQQLVIICLGCYEFAIFLTNHSKNFPKYPCNIPQTLNQQFEGIPFIWGSGDSWGMLPQVCWCSSYSCFPPDLHTIMAMTKFSGPSAAKFLFILKDLRSPAEVSGVSPVTTCTNVLKYQKQTKMDQNGNHFLHNFQL